MKCEFCGGEIPYDTSQCPSCGAPCEEIKSPVSSPQSSDANSPESDDSGAVKNFVSVDVSFLKSSNSALDEDRKAMTDFITKEDDSDYPIAKKGCLLLFVTIVAITGVVSFMFFK